MKRTRKIRILFLNDLFQVYDALTGEVFLKTSSYAKAIDEAVRLFKA